MPKIRYVGPIVGVDVVIAGLSGVEPGDEFDVDAEAAAHLLADDSMYVPADDAAIEVAEQLVAAALEKAAAAEADLAAAEAAAAGTDLIVDATPED